MSRDLPRSTPGSEGKYALASSSEPNDGCGVTVDPAGDPSTPFAVVQFTCAIYYCTEEDGSMIVDVARLGDARGVASFDYHTEESSAKAGVKFEASEGTRTFEPGETTMSIEIKIFGDDMWDSMLEFKMVISEVRGALKGPYLHTCRVKVMDDDMFPTNRFQGLTDKEYEAIPGLSLMHEYVVMNCKNRAIFRDSMKFLLMDQMKGLYFFLTLYLQIYLVDVVLAPSEEKGGNGNEGLDVEHKEERRLLGRLIEAGARSVARVLHEEGGNEGMGEEGMEEPEEGLVMKELIIPGHRRDTAMVIGLLYVLPFGILHLLNVAKCYLKVPGEPRKTIQANLLQKFLNYKEESRSEINTSEIMMVMMRDAIEVVDKGYMKILQIVGITGKLMFALIFILAENRMAVIPLIAYPVILACYLVARENITISSNLEKAEKQDEVLQTVNDAVANYRLIADFQLRPKIVDEYEKAIDNYHMQEMAACAVRENNMHMAPWLTTITIGVFIVVGAFQVQTVGGTLSLGAFLATINVFKEIGAEIQEIYLEAMEIQQSFGPLRKISQFMNMETDLADRMRINRGRRHVGKEMRLAQRGKAGASGVIQIGDEKMFAVDQVKMTVENLSFGYGDNKVLQNVAMEVDQGKMYAFVGPAHEGKATLLKLLGQALLPHENCGAIFIPPHLRILHVTQGECLLNADFISNIILGQSLERVGGFERVDKICRDVGFSEDVLLHLKESSNVKMWASRLSHTDFSRLNLARAFVMNPECLIIHKPAMVFGSAEVKKVISMIRKHVDKRGLELPESSRMWRRPRTVFFTSTTMTGAIAADEVYRVTLQGVTKIDKDKVKPEDIQMDE